MFATAQARVARVFHVQVRRANRDDIDGLVAMKRELIRSYFPRVDEYPDWPARAAAALAELLVRDTHVYLVAEAGGRIVGGLSGQLDLGIPGPVWPGVHATLADMYVLPEARGQGIARALMDAALAWARGRGCAKVKLHSTPMAVPVYEKLGFHVGVVKPGDTDFPTMWLDF